nr:hypothetical protein [Tanacetum cinerariifolium]
MSDSDESGVTYTDISSLFEELSDIRSLRADDHENLELPEMLEDPYVEVALQARPFPDYIPGPEEPEQAPPSLDYVPGPEHADDEIVAEDRPYAEDASPTAQSHEYVPESDLEAQPEDDDDEDPEEDSVDYPVDGGDDGDDEEGSSEDDEDDDMDIEADEEEEEEHPAPAESVVVASTAADQAPSAKETEPFETDESAATPPPYAYRMTDRISIPAPVPMPTWKDRPKVTLPPQKRLAGGLRADYGFVATMDREIMHDPEREVGYRITDSWDEIVETLQGAPVSTDTELGGYMREFETRVRQDANEIYMRLDDEQNATDLVRGEVMSLCTTVLSQMTEITELHAADRRRQIVISELLRADHGRSTEIIELRTALQGYVIALQGHVVLEGQNELLVNVLTLTFLSVNHYLSKALKDLPVFPNGVKEWSLSFISATAVENQVKFATCTLHSITLTWWNTHIKTVGHEAAYEMPWKTLMKMMTDKYCPRNEIKKLEMELWDMKVKESDKIEKYIECLPDMIHGSVVASKPKTMQAAVEIATELMVKKIRTFAKREIASKRKFENTSRNTLNQQQQSNKRQNTSRVYTSAFGEKKQYGGSKHLCAKCNYHHDGPCAPKCRNCNKIGHFAR